MVNNLSVKIESIFKKLQIKKHTKQEIETKFSENELNQFNNEITIFDQLQKFVDESVFNRSLYFIWVLYFNNFLAKSGIKQGNLKKDFSNLYNYFKPTIEFIDNLESILLKSRVNIDPKIYFQNFDLDSLKNMDLFLIQSILLDYNIVFQISVLIKEMHQDMKAEFEEIKLELKAILNNAANFWDVTDKGKFKYKRATLNNGHKNPVHLHLAESIISALICSINNIKDFNEEILENSLTPDLIREIVELFEFFEIYDFKNDTLKRLLDVFPKNSSLSTRKKMLIIHQILLYFNHPEAMNLKDDEVFLRKENSTITTLEQTKIRLVSRILGV